MRARSGLRSGAARLAAALGFVAVAPLTSAWYLPGSAPRSYAPDDPVPFSVNALQPMAAAPGNPNSRLPAPSGAGTGSDAHIRSLINLDYYSEQLHMCKPEGGPQSRSEGLGSVLFGDRIYSGPIQPHLLRNESCVHVCSQTVPGDDAEYINARIKEQYAVNWMVDGLPVATKKIADRSKDIFYAIGFPLGQLFDVHNLPLETPALNNHHDIYIEYHERKPNEFRIVGATVYPSSIDTLWGGQAQKPDCSATMPVQLSETGDNKIAFTYTARWVKSNTPWATRWDNYLRVFDPRIHWFAIINSLIIVALLMLMVRAVTIASVWYIFCRADLPSIYIPYYRRWASSSCARSRGTSADTMRLTWTRTCKKSTAGNWCMPTSIALHRDLCCSQQ